MKTLAPFRLVATVALFMVVSASVQDILLDSTKASLASCGYQNYAALGDSYSAGLYSYPSGELTISKPESCKLSSSNYTSANCSRNVGAYGYQFNYTSAFTSFQFTACSGADTFACQKSQVPCVNSDTDLISITIGGNNDYAFSHTVRLCVYEHALGECSTAIANASNAIASLDGPLTDLYTSIHTQAPNAKIVHLGYVEFWPTSPIPFKCEPDSSLNNPTPLEKFQMNNLLIQMNTKLATVAAANNVTFVDVNPAFEGHRLCDIGGEANTWIRWALPGRDWKDWKYENGVFHPNLQGQDTYLAALQTALNCSTSQPEKVQVMDEL